MKKQLADGLILRSLSENHASDRENLPDFYAGINTAGASDRVKEGFRHWVRSLISGHPTTTPDDVFVVVDPARDDMLVSATLLIPQTWRYDGISIAVGRPELVATHVDYRSRGLVRALFEVVHERSAALGHQVQGITGIPYFYRQFGYTMAVELGQHATFHLSALAAPAPDHKPAYSLRAATADDGAAISAWNAYFARERLLTHAYTPQEMHYEITGHQPDGYPYTRYLVIVNEDGEGVGYLTILAEPDEIRCIAYVMGPEASYLATFGDVMQAVKNWASAKHGRCPEMLAFDTGMHKTLDDLIDHSRGGGILRREYVWYLRVPDAIGFLRHITPVLEQRLEGSGAHRYSGELRIGFYNLKGISLKFEKGRLTDVQIIGGKDHYDVQFPWDMFWNVVFGYRTVDEISNVLPDVEANAKAIVLLAILFPKKKSFLIPLA